MEDTSTKVSYHWLSTISEEETTLKLKDGMILQNSSTFPMTHKISILPQLKNNQLRKDSGTIDSYFDG